MRLSVAIVNWNTTGLLMDCLSSIERYPPQGEYEVIVVDNASADFDETSIRTRFPNTKLIVNSENQGYAAGNNRAIEVSSGDFDCCSTRIRRSRKTLLKRWPGSWNTTRKLRRRGQDWCVRTVRPTNPFGHSPTPALSRGSFWGFPGFSRRTGSWGPTGCAASPTILWPK